MNVEILWLNSVRLDTTYVMCQCKNLQHVQTTAAALFPTALVLQRLGSVFQQQ